MFILYEKYKKCILFSLCFLIVFFIYFSTISENMTYNAGDLLELALNVEGRTAGNLEIAHVLWIPLGKLVYKFFLFMGYGGGAVRPLEILNIFLASLGSALFLVLVYELTGSMVLSFCLTILLSFSYGWWQQVTHPKLYGGGFLFIILSFYCYNKKNLKFKPFVFAAVNSLAILFHFLSISIVFSSIAYFILNLKNDKEKIINSTLFVLILLLILVGVYYLVHTYTPFYADFITFTIQRYFAFKTSWPNFLLYHSTIFLAMQSCRFDANSVWFIAYISLFTCLLMVSFNKIFKNYLFCLCAILAISLLVSIKTIDPISLYCPVILVPINIMLAIMLKKFNTFHILKRTAIGLTLFALASFLFLNNFKILYSTKNLNDDFFYNSFVVATSSMMSPKDIIFANQAIPFYLQYYLSYDVYNIDRGAGGSSTYTEFISKINYYINLNKRVLIFVHEPDGNKSPDSQNSINIEALRKKISKNSSVKKIYECNFSRSKSSCKLYEIKRAETKNYIN